MRLIDKDKVVKVIENSLLETGIKQSLVTKLVQIPTVDQWHYPSRGEYPTEGKTVFAAFQEGGLWYFAEAEYHEGGWASSIVDLGNIVAWQYIEPPKEEA